MTCSHERLIKFGKSQAGFQRFQCVECGYVSTERQPSRQNLNNVTRIQEIAKNLIQLKDEYNSIVSKTVLIAKEMGALLTEAQALIPTSQWTHWLSANVQMSRDAARRYMIIANGWDKIESHEEFPRLTMQQMREIAMGRPAGPRTANRSRPKRLDGHFEVIEDRLIEMCDEVPELQELIDAIEKARPYLVSAGLLADVENNISDMRARKAVGA